jgi:hypothetical protein
MVPRRAVRDELSDDRAARAHTPAITHGRNHRL